MLFLENSSQAQIDRHQVANMTRPCWLSQYWPLSTRKTSRWVARIYLSPLGRQRPIHMPIAMTIADKAMIVRSIVSHDGVCVEGCSSIALRLYPSASSPLVAQANVRQITRGQAFLRDPIGSARSHPGRAAAHTPPPAMSVMPAMRNIVSVRVSIQVLRMMRLNRWTNRRMVALLSD